MIAGTNPPSRRRFGGQARRGLGGTNPRREVEGHKSEAFGKGMGIGNSLVTTPDRSRIVNVAGGSRQRAVTCEDGCSPPPEPDVHRERAAPTCVGTAGSPGFRQDRRHA